jgi:hypothetical protein
MPNTKVNLYTVTPTATAAATFGESTRKTRRRSCRDTSATKCSLCGRRCRRAPISRPRGSSPLEPGTEHAVNQLRPDESRRRPGDGRVRIAEANEAYVNVPWQENNHVAKTVRVKAQELGRFAEFMRTKRKKEHIADLDRSDMLAYRDWMFLEGYMSWTVAGPQ